MQDLNDKVTGGSLSASEWNEVPSELQNVIEGLGQGLSSSDLNQLGKSIAGYAASGDFYTDSGVADAYVLTPIGSKQAPPTYANGNGLRIRFAAGNTNTGPSTVNVATLGVKSLLGEDGKALIANDLIAGTVYTFDYDGTDFIAKDVALQKTVFHTSFTVTVGGAGDFSTINGALVFLSKLQPLYNSTKIIATINLLAGFVMEEQVLVWGIDLSWVMITGVDAITDIDSSYLTVSPSSGNDAYGSNKTPAFGVYAGGQLPRIAQLFDMQEVSSDPSEELTGVAAFGAGTGAEISRDCGVINSGSAGLLANFGATIHAYDTNFSGANGRGCFANEGSTIVANSINVSNAGTTAIHSTDASVITAESANASGAGLVGLSANNGGVISAKSADASGCPTGVYAYHGSRIQAELVDASGCAIGIRALTGGFVNADAANASGCSSFGVTCEQGGHINADNVNAQMGGSPAGTDVRILTGSIVNFSNGTGGVSETINALTANGIIFDTGTVNGGISSIVSGTTSIAVTHNQFNIPAVQDIHIIGAEIPTNSVGDINITAIGATQFTVNVDNDPGASNWDFGWKIG